MRKNLGNESSYKTALIVVLVVFFVANFGMILLLNVFAERTYLEKVQEQTNTKLELAAAGMEQMDDIAKSALITISLNKKVNELFSYGISSPEEIQQTFVEISNLYTLSGGDNPEAFFYLLDYENNYIYSINSNERIHLMTDFSDNPIVVDIGEANSRNKFVRNYYEDVIYRDINVKQKSVFTYFYFEGNSVNYSGKAIVACFTKDWITNKLRSIAGGSDIMCIVSNGEIIVNTDEGYGNAADGEGILHCAESKRSYVIDGRDYSVFVNRQDGADVVLLSDNEVLFSPIYRIRTYIYIILSFLLISLLLSFPFSVKVINHIKRRTRDGLSKYHKFKDLYAKTENNYEPDMFGNDVAQLMRDFRIDGNKRCCVVFFTVDSRRVYYSLFPREAEERIKEELCRTILKHFEKYDFRCVISMRKNVFVLTLANLDDSVTVKDVKAVVSEIIDRTESLYGFTMSATVSNLVLFVNYVNAYTDANLLSENNFSTPYKTILDTEFEENEENLNLDIDEINECMNLAKLLKFDDFIEIIKKFLMRIDGNAPTVVKNYLSSVVNICSGALNETSKKYNVKFENIDKLQAIEGKSWKLIEFEEQLLEILNANKKIIEPLTKINYQNKKIMIANDAEEIVKNNYRDYNLSTASVADKLNLSSVYLCKVFSSVKNCQLNNFINEYRINKATELMKDNELTIKEIANQCGFMNTNYFYTLFKKYKKVTAIEYRSLMKKQGE
ncbi:MAG: helix-turn-helix transcriptional regulator [Christensenellales bacterium]